MIKKFAFALLIFSILFGLARLKTYIPAKSQLINKSNTRITNDSDIKSTSVTEKNFIHHKVSHPRIIPTIENSLPIIDDQKENNHNLNTIYSDKENDANEDEISQRKIDKSLALIKNMKLNYIKLSAFVTNQKNPLENLNKQKQHSTNPTNAADDDSSITNPQDESENDSEAENNENKIRCPPTEKIRQAAQQINDVFLYEGTYRITTNDTVFQENNLRWLVGVRGIIANSSDEGIYLAQLAASQANYLKKEYAELFMGDETMAVYLCDYGPGDVGAAGLWLKVLVEK